MIITDRKGDLVKNQNISANIDPAAEIQSTDLMSFVPFLIDKMAIKKHTTVVKPKRKDPIPAPPTICPKMRFRTLVPR